jgi:cell division septation protein DedD
MQRLQEEKGFSAWHLVLIFLAAVAVCAVFFSLGFVVGYNQRPTRTSTQTETVTPTTNIPPTVNPPPETSSQSSTESLTTETVAPSPAKEPPAIHPHPLAQAKPEQPTRPAQKSVGNSKLRPSAERKPSAPRESRAEATAATGRNAHFAVQVIASRTRADAITLIRLLEARHYPVFLVSPKASHTGDNLYRVQVGPYASRSEAERALHKLEREGFKPFIVH